MSRKKLELMKNLKPENGWKEMTIIGEKNSKSKNGEKLGS